MPELKYYSTPQEAVVERIKSVAKEMYGITDPDVIDNLVRIAFDKNEDPRHVIAASKILLDRTAPAVKPVELSTPADKPFETIVRFMNDDDESTN
jgi:3-methyladenine DNA glycosylase/8-oxoguanine DNA glycosylase